MNKYQQGCYPEDEIEFLGEGNLKNGLQLIANKGWQIRSIEFDHLTGLNYYFVEKKIIS